MKIIYVILSVLILFVTSCQKEEPYEPPTYNKIPDPPVTEVASFVGATWVIEKYQSLNGFTFPEELNDTLEFKTINLLIYNNVPTKYSLTYSGLGFSLTLYEISFFGNITTSGLTNSQINGGVLIRDFTDLINTNVKWRIWMKKI